MLDIAEHRIYAHSFSMSTLGKLRLKQMLSKLLTCKLEPKDTGMKGAIADAYMIMSSVAGTTTVARN